MFGSVLKDTKPKNRLEVETVDSKQSIEELLTIFSAANFPNPIDTATKEKIDTNHEEDVNLDIGTFTL